MGLDLSLTGTGVVIYRPEETKIFGKVLRARLLETETVGNRKDQTPRVLPSGKFVGLLEDRIEFIARRIIGTYTHYRPEFVCIEEYAFSAQGRALSGLHELGGVVKYRLRRHAALYHTPTSTELKKFATGDGRATKEQMIEAAWGFGYPECDNDNLADAFHLARFAAYHYDDLVLPA